MKPGLPLSFRERKTVLSRAMATVRVLTVLGDVRLLRRSPIAFTYGLSSFALHRPTAFGETDFEVLPAVDSTCAECDLVAGCIDPGKRVNLVRGRTSLLLSNGASDMRHS